MEQQPHGPNCFENNVAGMVSSSCAELFEYMSFSKCILLQLMYMVVVMIKCTIVIGVALSLYCHLHVSAPPRTVSYIMCIIWVWNMIVQITGDTLNGEKQ